MAILADVMAYFCERYPFKEDLSKARLTKMVYLADWRMAIEAGRQVSPIRWKFNHFGPYVEDVINLAKADPRFVVVADKNVYGQRKDRIALHSAFEPETLTPEDRAALDHVIEKTRRLSWEEFIRLIYSTYPVLVSERHSELDLVRLAGKYRQESFAG